MRYDDVLATLKEYIIHTVLDDAEVEIDASTPLLEWGIMNSLEIVRLVNFLKQTYDVTIPPNKLTGENFSNLASITKLVLS